METIVKCDVSGQELLIRNGHCIANTQTGEWCFCSTESSKKLEFPSYDIALDRLIQSEADLIDGLVHLHRKNWFKPELFFSFLDKFKSKNHFLGG